MPAFPAPAKLGCPQVPSTGFSLFLQLFGTLLLFLFILVQCSQAAVTDPVANSRTLRDRKTTLPPESRQGIFFLCFFVMGQKV